MTKSLIDTGVAILLTATAGMCCVTCAKAADKPGVLTIKPAADDADFHWSASPWAKSVAEAQGGGQCLKLTVPQDNAAPIDGSVQQDVTGKAIKQTAGTFQVARTIDLSKLRGWRVDLTARIRSVGVSEPSQPWEGVRLGFDFKTPWAGYNADLYGQPRDADWHYATLHTRIPADATEASLFVGMISSSGTMWIDDIHITPVQPPMHDLAAARKPIKSVTHWRGSGIASSDSAEAISDLGKNWHINVVKSWMSLPSSTLSDTDFDKDLQTKLVKLDGILDAADKAGVKVIPQLSTPDDWHDAKLGRTELEYLQPAMAARIIHVWDVIARRYAGRKTIWGYDLLNETVLRTAPAPGCPDWEGLAQKAAKTINKVDPKVRVVVQAEEWWGTLAFNKLHPINAKNVVYSVHMYAPFSLTHQGLTERHSMGVAYPGMIDGVMWDKEMLRKALQPTRDFQLAYGVPIQVGEFSCIRWAENGSAGRWVTDCISLFEEYGWDWTYHGVLDWDGWNPEYGEDPKETAALPQPGPVKQTLLNAYARNEAAQR